MLGCGSFTFQHIYTKPYITYKKELVITFPAGETLTFSEADSTFPSQLALGNNGDLDSEILADLDELGYDLENGIAIVNIDTESLAKAIALNPGMFTIDGLPIPFGYENFPDGVYKSEFSFFELPTTATQTGGDPTQMGTSISGIKYELKMCCALKCRAQKIEDYFEQNCKTPRNCKKRKELSELITRMRMLELGALWDFSQKDYDEASSKVEAMQLLCQTGKCNYKVGC